MNYKKLIFISILVIFALIQLIRIDKINPEIIQGNDFLISVQAPQEISSIVKTSCYDCHSNETVYPWYSNMAPISWMLKSHITEARDNLNFSEWSNFSYENKIAIFEDCMSVIEEGEMPLKSYTMIHKEAKLTADEKTALIAWLKLQEDNLTKSDTLR